MKKVRRILIIVLVLGIIMINCGVVFAEKGQEPFAEFSKDTTYEDIATKYKADISSRTENVINFENQTVFDDITGEYYAFFDNTELTHIIFRGEMEGENYTDAEETEWNDSSIEKIVNYYNEEYGEAEENNYKKSDAETTMYDTIWKWVNLKGEIIILIRQNKQVDTGRYANTYEMNHCFRAVIFYNQNEYKMYTKDYIKQ